MRKALALLLLLISYSAFGQITEFTIRAILLQKFSSYIEWPHGAIQDSFTIAIAGRDTSMITSLIKLTRDQKIHKKPIKIKTVQNPNDDLLCNVLYLSPTENYRIERYWERIEQNNTLFITESLSNMLFSMINIEKNETSKTFSFVVNKSNLMIANLKAMPNLLLVGGTEIDIRDLYKSTKLQLDKELEKVNKQKTLILEQLDKISTLDNKLANQSSKLESQLEIINSHRNKISSQTNRLDSLKNRITSYEDSIKNNKILIHSQKEIISQQHQSVDIKESELDRLNTQLRSIARQIHNKQLILNEKEEQLEEKDSVISDQKQYLLLSLVGSVFILSALSFIFYAYRTKSIANKKLDEKNLILEAHQDEIHKQSEELLTINNQLNAQKHELEITIEKLKETQAQLIHSEKMASLGTLTAGIAHEINNPINFITTGVEGLKTVTQPISELMEYISKMPLDSEVALGIKQMADDLELLELTEGLILMIRNIETGAIRAAEIVRGLSEFSRSRDSGKMPINIKDCIESTLLIVNSEIKNRIKINKYYEPIPPINCYPSKLNQVLLNIISNACQAINGKGTIQISTSMHGKDHMKIKIGDSGAGIDPKDMPRIFEPFYTTKDVGKGTGLGLAISYSLIEQHKGTITVKSEKGKGTEFTITLPIYAEDETKNS